MVVFIYLLSIAIIVLKNCSEKLLICCQQIYKWFSPLLSCSYSFWSCKTRADFRSDAFIKQTGTVFVKLQY